MKRTTIILLAIIAVLVSIASALTYSYYTNIIVPEQQSEYYYNQQIAAHYSGYGMMGGMMGNYSGYGIAFSTIPITQAINMMREVPQYAKVFPNNDTIVFNSTQITLVVLAMGHERAENLTGYIPPSYAQHDVFVIYGLINPTLIIPRGSIVNVIIINLDDDTYHNIAITPVPPPYPYYTMMYVRMNILGMSPFLHYADYNNGVAYQFSFTVNFGNSGTYYYICEYPGHAQMGMYGTIIVT